MIAITRATKKMILAIPTALAAIPKNPKTPAISAMMKNVIAQENIVASWSQAHCSIDANGRNPQIRASRKVTGREPVLARTPLGAVVAV